MFDAMSVPVDVPHPESLKKTAGVFQTRTNIQEIGGCNLINGYTNQDFPIQIVRGRSEIARLSSETFFLHLQNSGNMECAYTKQERGSLKGGEWILGRTSDQYRITLVPGETTTLLLAFPDHLVAGLQLGDDAFGRHMEQNSLPNQLVANYVRTLAAGQAIPNAAGEAVIRNLMGLIALAMNSEIEASRAGVSSGMLLVLLQYLDAHYTRADLSPTHVAANFGITPRHVHRLFERTGMTFSEQLFARRLDRAHRMLSDAGNLHRSITDIAYDVGFSDLAHFSRKYREKFGTSPSETKASHKR